MMHVIYLTPSPWTERWTDTCENVTFPQRRLPAVKITHWNKRGRAFLFPDTLQHKHAHIACSTWFNSTDIVYPKDTTDLVIILQCNNEMNKTIDSVRKVRLRVLLKVNNFISSSLT